MTFLIERVPVPSWVRSPDAEDMELMRDSTGEEIGWSAGIPLVYRALASPRAHEPLLSAPQRGEQAMPAATSYWSALLNLLVYSFGWARPDRGLLWWEWAGKPIDDPRFELLSRVWDADGMLDWFATWLYTAPRSPVLPLLAELTGYAADDEDVPRNQGWIDDQLDVADASGIPAPCSRGGYDPLHLAEHAIGPLAVPRGPVRLLRSTAQEHNATLTVESMVGWYRALVESAATLPALDDRSWHVDVYARPVGFLGTFRRSRVSGIWFSGPHRYHVPGFDAAAIG